MHKTQWGYNIATAASKITCQWITVFNMAYSTCFHYYHTISYFYNNYDYHKYIHNSMIQITRLKIVKIQVALLKVLGTVTGFGTTQVQISA